jgi:hypothetical protein
MVFCLYFESKSNPICTVQPFDLFQFFSFSGHFFDMWRKCLIFAGKFAKHVFYSSDFDEVVSSVVHGIFFAHAGYRHTKKRRQD